MLKARVDRDFSVMPKKMSKIKLGGVRVGDAAVLWTESRSRG